MIDMKRTGQRIRQACEERNITVKQIQNELGIGAFQSVYQWFQGKNLPSLDNFYRLCKLLGVPMESLIVETLEILPLVCWLERYEKPRKYLLLYRDCFPYSVTN